MHIETIQGKQFAFELNWMAAGKRDVRRKTSVLRNRLRAEQGAHGGHFYSTVVGRKDQQAVGGALLPKRNRKPIYSYAGTLAALGRDGIYAIGRDVDTTWLCVIYNGTVVEDTDVFVEHAEAIRRVTVLRDNLRFDTSSIYADTTSAILDATEFDPEAALGHTRHPAKLNRYVNRGAVLAGIVLLLLAGAGFAGVVAHHANVVAAQQAAVAQQRVAAISAYQTAAKHALDSFPANPNWPVSAWQQLSTHMAVYIGGYALTQIQCHPRACVASYAPSNYAAGIASLAPFYAAFGRNVKLPRKGNTVSVTLPMVRSRRPSISSAFLHNPPKASPLINDWARLAPLHVIGLTGKPRVTTTDLATKFRGKQVGYPELHVQTVTLTGSSSFPLALASAMNWGGKADFRVTGFVLSTSGKGGINKWAMTLEAVYGYNAGYNAGYAKMAYTGNANR